MEQLYTTSHVSNITRKTKFSHISCHVSNIILKSVKTENILHIKLHLFYCGVIFY